MLTKDEIIAYAKTQGIIITTDQLSKAERNGDLKPCAIYYQGKYLKHGESKYGLRLYPLDQINTLLNQLATQTGQTTDEGWLTTPQVKRLYGKPPRQLLRDSYTLVERKGMAATTMYRESDIMALGYRRLKLCLHAGCNNYALPNQEYGFSFCAEHKKQFQKIGHKPPSEMNAIIGTLTALINANARKKAKQHA